MKEKFTFTHGAETRTVELDPGKLAAPFISPRKPEGPGGSPRDVLVETLAKPVGRPRLREMVAGKKAAMIISDEFRAGLHETILDVMIEEMAAGKPEKVTILCATGTHDPGIYCPDIRKWTTRSPRPFSPITMYFPRRLTPSIGASIRSSAEIPRRSSRISAPTIRVPATG